MPDDHSDRSASARRTQDPAAPGGMAADASGERGAPILGAGAATPRAGLRRGYVLALVLLVAVAGGTSLALLGGSTRPALPGGAHQSAAGQGSSERWPCPPSWRRRFICATTSASP